MFKNICLVYNITHVLALPPQYGVINFKSTTSRVTKVQLGRELHDPNEENSLSYHSFKFNAMKMACWHPKM